MPKTIKKIKIASADPYPKSRNVIICLYAYIAILSVPFAPPVNTLTRSNTLKASRVLNSKATSREGFTIGSVILKKR